MADGAVIDRARTIALGAGRLHIDVTRADWPLEALCGFAARNNPRRAFLVVSNVLGRHVGVAPSVMRATFRDLAAKIPADLPGPVLVVGLAETAICLGQGVHEEVLRRTRRRDVLFLHTTRQRIAQPELCRFEEPHSHASSHIVYRPYDSKGRFAAPRSLVMIDDEISTGTTLANLATAVVAALPTIERAVAVTLTDWSLARDWTSAMPVPVAIESLLAGTLAWEGPCAATPSARFADAARALGTMASHRNFGRLGRSDVAHECDSLADGLALPAGAALRVIGTGEFTYPPFRFAERLEARGHDVLVQSTTRSPAHLDGALRTGLSFADNYATGVANHLYNADPNDGRINIICHETPDGSIDPALVAALSARTVAFGVCG